MGSIEDEQLLCSENSCRRFSGQNCDIYGAALADGVQRVHEILPIFVMGIAEVEGQHCSGFSIYYRTGFSSFAYYNVELLS